MEKTDVHTHPFDHQVYFALSIYEKECRATLLAVEK
jgi:hypothetical protein